MKKVLVCMLLLLCLCACGAMAEEAGTVPLVLDEIGLKTEIPSGWTVVWPGTVAQHMQFFDEETSEEAANAMHREGVVAIAFSPEGDAMLRILTSEGDADVQLYYDIERYTAQMRTQIANHFLNKSAWTATGFRCSEANWTNREGQGRILWMVYTIRVNDETVARGRQAFTIRNGLEITLDLRVKGRQVSTAEGRIFDNFVKATEFPVSVDMPLLPVGLTVTGTVPEETNKAEFTVRGETMRGATVSATLYDEAGVATAAGSATANASGVFKLDVTMPAQGEWRLAIQADLEGYASCMEGRWIYYNPSQLPVTFTSYPEGDWYESQIIVSGNTISGVKIQCMENGVNKTVTTGSGGAFSFKMDRGITGPRTIVLSFTKDGYANRRFDIEFNRMWTRDDYAKYLSSSVQSLSHANLSENGAKYIGRIVKYTGEVLDVSSVGERTYIQLGLKKNKVGHWTERIIAVADGQQVTLRQGDSTTLYIEVTGEAYTFSELNTDGDEVNIDLPSVKLLTYQ